MHQLGVTLYLIHFGNGRISAVNMLLKSNVNLNQMCHLDTTYHKIAKVGAGILLRLYGGQPGSDLSNFRYHLFGKKKDPPKIKAAPMNEAAAFHVNRAHLQTLIWDAADYNNPPKVSITKYGWEIKEQQDPILNIIWNSNGCPSKYAEDHSLHMFS
jgi:hypothetical protein